MLQHDAGSLTQNLAETLAQQIYEESWWVALRCGGGGFTDAYQSVAVPCVSFVIVTAPYLMEIFPRRAPVRILTAQNVQDLYDLSTELYILLGTLLTQRWQTQGQLLPFLEVRRAMQLSVQKNDVEGFVKHCFAVADVAAPIVNNLYLQQALANIIPAVSRTYYLAFKQRCPEMAQLTRIFDQLLVAVQARQPEDIRVLLQSYAQTNCQLALRALPREC